LVATGIGMAMAACFTACGDSDGGGSSTPDAALPLDEAGIDTGVAAEAAVEASVEASCGEVTSAKNCGACGHDCLAGSCTAGVCGPFTLVTSTSVSWLDADDDGAYFLQSDGLGDGPVLRVSLAGGMPTQLVASFAPLMVATTTSSVVGFDSSHALVAVKKDGSSNGTPKVLTTNPLSPNSLVGGGGRYAIATISGEAVRVVDETTGVVSAFAGADFMFPIVATGSLQLLAITGKLTSLPLPPGADGPLPAAQTLAFSATRCTSSGTRLVCSTPDSIVSVPLATPTAAATTIVKPVDPALYPSTGYPRSLTADATSVYWYDGTSGAVVSCPLSGCTTPKVIAADVGDAALVAVTSKLVVFSDAKNKTLRAVVK
jgi:hypothetical protein